MINHYRYFAIVFVVTRFLSLSNHSVDGVLNLYDLVNLNRILTFSCTKLLDKLRLGFGYSIWKCPYLFSLGEQVFLNLNSFATSFPNKICCGCIRAWLIWCFRNFESAFFYLILLSQFPQLSYFVLLSSSSLNLLPIIMSTFLRNSFFSKVQNPLTFKFLARVRTFFTFISSLLTSLSRFLIFM